MGQMISTVLGMVAQMERRFIKERQREGIELAKVRGTYAGGKRRIDRQRVIDMADAKNSVAAIASAVGCSRMQIYRILKDIRLPAKTISTTGYCSP
jgi:DNA invertase Pin-like site-specific DNA recombinase